MINDAVDYIRREVRSHLGVDDTDVIIGDIHALKDDANRKGAYISLVNVEEEAALRNTEHHVRINDRTRYLEPAVHLNLYLLFAFEFGSYGTSLLRLSQTVELFQAKRVYSAANEVPTNPFPASLDRLIFDLHNLGLEQLNHLWGVLGGAYLPSVLYKVRLSKVQRDEPIDAPEIRTVQVDTVLP